MPSDRPLSIQQLPVELLAEVFRFGANLNWPHDDSPFLLKSNSSGADFIYDPDFQITVSHVCRSWRSIALGLPSLWTTLHFSRPSHIPRARAFLQRCEPSSRPRVFKDDNDPKFNRFCLDILVLTVARPSKEPQVQAIKEEGQCLIDDHLAEIFALLTPQTLLWRSFHLRVRDGNCKREARKALGGTCQHASRLQTLQLYHFEDFGSADELHEATYRRPVECFANHVPQLRHVSLIGVNLPWENSPYLTDLHSLELALHLDNVRIPYSRWRDILKESPHLKSLCLHYSGPKKDDLDSWDPDKEMQAIRLERLEQLSLIDLDSDYLAAFLRRLVIPNVKRLELELNSEDQDYTNMLKDWTSNQGFGLGNISAITSLRVTALECDLTVFAHFLRSLKGLQELELDFDKVCMGEEDDQRSSDVWKLFAGKEDEIISADPTHNGSLQNLSSSSSSSSSTPFSTTFLPRLRVFKMFRLPGTHVRDIIKYREGLGREQHRRVNSDGSDVSSSSSTGTLTPTSPYSPTMTALPMLPSGPGTFPVTVIPEMKQRSKYIVKYTEQMKGKDKVLDQLVTKGYCWFPEEDRGGNNAVEDGAGTGTGASTDTGVSAGASASVSTVRAEEFVENGEEEGLGVPAKVLRKFGPEVEAHRKNKDEGGAGEGNRGDGGGGSPGLGHGRMVVVESELVEGNDEEDDDFAEEEGDEVEEGSEEGEVYSNDDGDESGIGDGDEDEDGYEDDDTS